MNKTSDRERFGQLLALCDTLTRLLKGIRRTMDRIGEDLDSYQETIKNAIELHEDTIERWNEEDEEDDTTDTSLADRVTEMAIEEARIRRAERKI